MLTCQKHLFQLDDNHHYLNGAFLSPLLKSVEQAGIDGIRMKNRPWEVTPADFFEDSNRVRRLFSELVSASSADQIAILPSVSYGMGIVTKNLPVKKGGNIVVAGDQFPSNVYPWMRYCKEHGCSLKIVEAPAEFQDRGRIWNEKILDAIDEETILVALSNVHWTDGTLFDLEKIGEVARSNNVWFVIDATQSVGAMPFDVQTVQPDALICAGYKWLMGPYGTSLGYFGEKLKDGVPLEEGWIVRKYSRDFAGLVDYEEEYEPGAHRFDVGERSNFINMPMMAKALEQILEWGPANIQNYCREISKEAIQKLRKQGFRIEDEKWRGAHLFGIHLPEKIDPEQVRQKLSEENIHVSVRGKAVRVSLNVYNTREDLLRLSRILKELVP